jgi:carboxypeptidase C (cathepsin A)
MSSEEKNGKDPAEGKNDKATLEVVKDNLSLTQHTITLNGQTIPYTVTCGTIVFKEEVENQAEKKGEFEGEKPKASFFFIAYTRDDVEQVERRPLTFSFNGGPGSSSVWLHMGLLGPRRVLMTEKGDPLPPPFRLVDNEATLLDWTDLVFIDPVSTGFSRVVPGEKARQFHGVKKDVESVGDFIRLYTTRYKRWGSPKFLIGESYGTTRAAGLAGYLQERHGMYLNGIMLVSVVLNFQTVRFETSNDLTYPLFLPTYTASAWYHNRLPADLQADLYAALQEAEAFAGGEYPLALMKGASLPAEERRQVIQKLARLTGLSEEYIERTDLRINIHRFTKELLRSERRTIGRIDSRFTGIDRDAAGEYPEYDPSITNIMGCYSTLFNHYVRSELEYESDIPYEVLNMKVWPWSYAEHENRFLDVGETLRKAMTINPFLKVYVANGYYDLATPYFATQYTLNHLSLDPSLQDQITVANYEAGHMMYAHRPSLIQMKEDLADFIQNSLPEEQA